ncbi:hypothetical protein [Halorhabdus rudnickae]|uniref:hypothetical protein n=1 Tax=Halorhabdus rudnickae TaxID=1775544 RepID=UPI001082B4FB|nr:hypothetical protein [Halorhabdus rudnickae]
MIVVATADFELYHGVVTELRDRGVTFTTIEPDDPLPERTEAVVVGPEDSIDGLEDVTVVEADPAEPRRAVEDLLATLRGGEGQVIVGVDPGEKPGIAVLAGDVVIGAFQVPAAQVGDVVRREIEGATDPLVRIGDGARLVGSRIVDDLADVPVEVVDETGTTPYLGTGARGMGDVLAAVNIARIEGKRVDSIDIEPTAGELQRIKDRSREAGADNRAIDERLARRVAAGELSIEEALAQHRGSEE